MMTNEEIKEAEETLTKKLKNVQIQGFVRYDTKNREGFWCKDKFGLIFLGATKEEALEKIKKLNKKNKMLSSLFKK